MEGEVAGPGASVEATLYASTKQTNWRPSVEDPTGGAGRKCFYLKNKPYCVRDLPFLRQTVNTGTLLPGL